MLNCMEPQCIGWHLLPKDQFCSWCGSQLAELEFGFELREGDAWRPLDPALLIRDQRPALRLLLKHAGRAGQIPVAADKFRISVGWMGLALKELQPVLLEPGDEMTIAVDRLKVPGKEDSYQSVRIDFEAGPVKASSELLFVPPPVFTLELASETILLLPDEPAVIDATLRLSQGMVVMRQPPEFGGRWVNLHSNADFPLELDARGRSRLPLQLRVVDDTVAQLRQSALSLAEERLRRGGVLKLPGVVPAAEGRSDIVLPVEVGFLLGPELYVEPFRERSRLDVRRLHPLESSNPIELSISNGLPGTRGRIELLVRHLDIESQGDWLTLEGGQLPVTVSSGESSPLRLRMDGSLVPGREATARLTFVTNDPAGRDYHLRLQLQAPKPYPGWLVVDLGTSNTCAALVDSNQAVTVLELEESSRDDDLTTLPSAVSYLKLADERLYEVGSWALDRASHPAAARSVVTAAKRYLGDADHRFEVVPVDEQNLTERLTAVEVVTDLFAHVIKRARDYLVAQGESQVCIDRLLVCHPSRFSMLQIEQLKEAAVAAQTRVLGDDFTLAAPHTLHEPLGAALHGLNRWQDHAPLHQRAASDECTYHLLVYDFGGGTLDITLTAIHSRRRPLGGGGKGPDLRERVLQQLSSTCEELVGADYEVSEKLREENAFLMQKFSESMLEAFAAGVPASELVEHPAVSERLTLTVENDSKPKELVFTRRQLLEDQGAWRQVFGDLEHPYRYTVTPEVLGATGDRWLGGEDVTDIVEEMLLGELQRVATELFPDSSAEFPISDLGHTPAQGIIGRRNRHLVRDWAERLKVALALNADPEQLRDTFLTVYFWVDGKEEMVSATPLWKVMVLPTLESIEERIRPALENSLRLIDELLERLGLAHPEVVLRVGRASKLPIVDRILRSAFPEALHRAPKRAKRCVVEGAATYPVPGGAGGGLQLSRGGRRPSVRVRWPREQVFSATTSRLGLKIVEGGRAFFHCLIEAGVPMPAEGLEARVEGVVLQSGENFLPVLENAGHRDELILDDGQPNPDICTIRQVSLTLPEGLDEESLEEACVVFYLNCDFTLSLEVRVEGLEPLRFNEIPAESMGRRY